MSHKEVPPDKGSTEETDSARRADNEAIDRVLHRAETDMRAQMRDIRQSAQRGVVFGVGSKAGQAFWEHVVDPLIHHH